MNKQCSHFIATLLNNVIMEETLHLTRFHWINRFIVISILNWKLLNYYFGNCNLKFCLYLTFQVSTQKIFGILIIIKFKKKLKLTNNISRLCRNKKRQTQIVPLVDGSLKIRKRIYQHISRRASRPPLRCVLFRDPTSFRQYSSLHQNFI